MLKLQIIKFALIKIAWNTAYCHLLTEHHRFPMEKYNLLPQQLIYEGTINPNQLFSPHVVEDENILNCHHYHYLHKLNSLTLTPSEIRKIGFPLSKELVVREKIIVQGTIDAALFALNYKISFNIAGGTHHAFSDRGEGFCLLNDMAIAACYLLKKNLASKILIIDLDVHQGNGTASIFKNKTEVFTFSMHGKKNYPLFKENSDLDIALEDGTDDDTYINLLDIQLEYLFTSVQPDFVFYQAGVDVLMNDKLGRLALTLNGCKRRDSLVFKYCHERNIPIVITMGGGYSQNIKTIIEAHANTYRIARDFYNY